MLIVNNLSQKDYCIVIFCNSCTFGTVTTWNIIAHYKHSFSPFFKTFNVYNCVCEKDPQIQGFRFNTELRLFSMFSMCMCEVPLGSKVSSQILKTCLKCPMVWRTDECTMNWCLPRVYFHLCLQVRCQIHWYNQVKSFTEDEWMKIQ